MPGLQCLPPPKGFRPPFLFASCPASPPKMPWRLDRPTQVLSPMPLIPRCPVGKIPTGLAPFTKEITTGFTTPNTVGSTPPEGMPPVPGFGAPSRSGFGQAPVFTPTFTATRMPRGSISWPQPSRVKFITTTDPRLRGRKLI